MLRFEAAMAKLTIAKFMSLPAAGGFKAVPRLCDVCPDRPDQPPLA